MRPVPTGGVSTDMLAPWSTRHNGQQLIGDVRGGNAGQLSVVVGRGDLDDVGRDDVEVGEGPKHHEQFARRQAASLGSAGAWRVGRVQDVDVHGHVDGLRAEALAYLVDRDAESLPLDVDAGHRGEAKPLAVRQVVYRIQRPTDPYVHRVLEIDQTFLGRAPERCAVGIWGTEVGVPRV